MKRRKLVAAMFIVTTASAGSSAALIACSSSSDTVLIPSFADAGSPTESTADGSLDPARGTGIPCAPQTVAFDASFPTPPARYSGACTNAQIASLTSACPSPTVNTPACDAARTSVGAACVSCMYGLLGAGTSPAIDLVPEITTAFYDVPGCIALVEHDAGPESCAAKIYANYSCQYASCVHTCPVNSTAEQKALDDCYALAETTTCAAYAGPALGCYPDDAGVDYGDGGSVDQIEYCDPATFTTANALAHYAFFCGSPVDNSVDAGEIDAADASDAGGDQ